MLSRCLPQSQSKLCTWTPSLSKVQCICHIWLHISDFPSSSTHVSHFLKKNFLVVHRSIFIHVWVEFHFGGVVFLPQRLWRPKKSADRKTLKGVFLACVASVSVICQKKDVYLASLSKPHHKNISLFRERDASRIANITEKSWKRLRTRQDTDGVALWRRIDPTSVIQEIVVPATLWTTDALISMQTALFLNERPRIFLTDTDWRTKYQMILSKQQP